MYPIGWTLLHALTDLGDLKGMQELLKLSGKEPLGFAVDIRILLEAWGEMGGDRTKICTGAMQRQNVIGGRTRVPWIIL